MVFSGWARDSFGGLEPLPLCNFAWPFSLGRQAKGFWSLISFLSESSAHCIRLAEPILAGLQCSHAFLEQAELAEIHATTFQNADTRAPSDRTLRVWWATLRVQGGRYFRVPWTWRHAHRAGVCPTSVAPRPREVSKRAIPDQPAPHAHACVPHMYVCLCICVCMREREREREMVFGCVRENMRVWWRIFGDSSVTVAQWWRARHSRKLVIRKAPGSIPAENTSPQIHMDLST